MAKYIFIVILGSMLVSGCSTSAVIPDSDQERLEPRTAIGIPSNQWIWGNYTIRIKGDLSSAEVIPHRAASLHLNVTPFIEGPPCPDCLWVGKPHGAPNGTILLKITLQHPFKWNPEYTGFDVRGITVFKATEYWKDAWFILRYQIDEWNEKKLMNPLLVNYSDPSNGGAALLNPDGYTVYLNPLIEYPGGQIFNYSKGKYAYGDNVDCTINPYKLFADQSHRRMFKGHDIFVREYHLKPPAWGEDFEFGYVISACWAKPAVQPVTNPETDFPVNANCEDPYEISIVQLQPITYSSGAGSEPIFIVTVRHAPGHIPKVAAIKMPTLSSDVWYSDDSLNNVFQWLSDDYPNDVEYIDDETTRLTMRIHPPEWHSVNNQLVPGYHTAIFFFGTTWSDGTEDGYLSQMVQTVGVHAFQAYAEVDE